LRELPAGGHLHGGMRHITNSEGTGAKWTRKHAQTYVDHIEVLGKDEESPADV